MYTIFIPTEQELRTIFPSCQLVERGGFKGIEHNGAFIYQSGIGKTNTAITFTRYLLEHTVDDSTPILMGIAGAYRGANIKSEGFAFRIGDIAMIEDDFFVDEAKFTGALLDSTSLLGFPVVKGNKVRFSTDDFDLPICNANTVSLLGDEALTALYHKATGAHMESMEGAAFGTVAKVFGRKAIHIRAVSNYCASDDWNPKKACRALADFIEEIIK